jgi:hypothetical protein
MMNRRTHWLLAFICLPTLAVAQIPLSNLNAHYGFNGNLNDLSGNANHIVSASGSFTTDRFGVPGNAFLFDGINDSLTIPVPEFAPLQGDFTISFWYKTNSPQIMNLFSSKQFASDTTDNFEVQLNSHNPFYLEYLKQTWYQTFIYWNGSGHLPDSAVVAEGAPGAFLKGEWCHFVLTRTADTMRIYRNSSMVWLSESGKYGGQLGDAVDFIFGAAPHRFKGAIDDIRLYNCSVNDAEVIQLWHEDQPLYFKSPKPTDAYVPGSVLLVEWMYNDSVLSDSIRVEYRLNNGAWQMWLPHSQMAYEYAFYMPLNYAPGTEIEIRVTDVADSSVRLSSGSFLISEYDWQEMTSTLPFNSKDGAGLLTFNNQMWLLGGWDPPHHPPAHTHSEIWTTTDGILWTPIGTALWPARHCGGWLSCDTAMWVIGGDPQSGCLTDVWKSTDGSNWYEQVNAIPGYSNRNNANYAITDSAIFMFGGEVCSVGGTNEVWKSTDGANWTQLPDAPWSGRGMQINSCVDDQGQIWMLGGSNEGDRRSYNEVWKTSDGINWTLVNESAPWGGRNWHTVAWFDNKIWLMAGMLQGSEMNDVWYSSDGITWHELKSTTGNWPAGTRHAQSTTVYDNALWYMCGISTNNVWKIVNGLTVGEKEPAAQLNRSYQLYPNPASGTLFVSAHGTNAIGGYQVMNALGEVVKTGVMLSANGEVELGALPSGFYFITFAADNAVIKFIKQ